MILKNVFLLIIIFIHTICIGQIKLKAIASYEYSFGLATGGLHNYIPGKVYDGFHFHWRYFLKRDFSVGLSAGWNSFKKELPRDIYETDKGTVSAIQIRYFHTFPLVITGYYYLRSLHYVMPYVGGAIGPYITRYEKYYGVVPIKEGNIRLGLRPEIGVVIPFKNSWLGLIINGRFNNVFYSHAEVNNLRFFEAAIGLYFGRPVFEDPFSDK